MDHAFLGHGGVDDAHPEQAPGDAVELSVIIPCYRSAAIAAQSMRELRSLLQRSRLSWEIIVVDDGGGDFVEPWPESGAVRLLTLPHNMGKGAAIRHGMLAARGRVRIFTDVDLPYDPDLIFVMVEYIVSRGFHVVIGDRTLPGSTYEDDIDWKRRLASRVFTKFVGTVVTGGFFDTQCGLKGFRGDVADELFRLSRVNRFAADAEMIYLALVHRLDIKRIPVRLRNNETSSIRLFRDSLRAAADICGIPLRRIRGGYRSSELARVTATEFAGMQSTAQAQAKTPSADESLRAGAKR